MKHEEPLQFKTAQQNSAALSMIDAIKAAKAAVIAMTELQIDSIVKCAQNDHGGWTISLDVVESLARMGDNDLLATFEIAIGQNADLLSYNRLRRYHREDQDA